MELKYCKIRLPIKYCVDADWGGDAIGFLPTAEDISWESRKANY